MKLVSINFKGSAELKEAIRIVAFNQGHNNRSKTAIEILEKDPEVKKELSKLKPKKKTA
jgi:hypothetical protein